MYNETLPFDERRKIIGEMLSGLSVPYQKQDIQEHFVLADRLKACGDWSGAAANAVFACIAACACSDVDPIELGNIILDHPKLQELGIEPLIKTDDRLSDTLNDLGLIVVDVINQELNGKDPMIANMRFMLGRMIDIKRICEEIGFATATLLGKAFENVDQLVAENARDLMLEMIDRLVGVCEQYDDRFDGYGDWLKETKPNVHVLQRTARAVSMYAFVCNAGKVPLEVMETVQVYMDNINNRLIELSKDGS